MKRIYPLYAAADEARVKPILEALKAKGVPVRDSQADPAKEDALLLFLSENVSAGGPEAEAFFRLNAERELVIPINLDGSAPPEELQNALMARHALDGSRYAPEELADRIALAARGKTKRRLPLVLSIAAAAILLLAGGVVLWRNRKASPPETPAVEASPTPAPTAAPTEKPHVDGIETDLSLVAEVVYVGDVFKYYQMFDGYYMGGTKQDNVRSYTEVAYDVWDDGPTFYSVETGQQIPMAELGDVSYLRYLPNLMYLTFVNVKGELPDLSMLHGLRRITIINCEIPDIEGLRGCGVSGFEYRGATVKDFSPLSDCQQLSSVDLSIYGAADTDLGAFGPPALTHLYLRSQGDQRSIDLSGLAACRKLEVVELSGLPVTDLGFLSGTTVLGRISLIDLPRLTSLKGLENRPLLGNVYIDSCFELRDLSALSSCVGLGEFCMEDCPVADLSFLSGAKSLKALELRNMNSLRSFHGLEDHRTLESIRVSNLRDLRDISALGSCVDLESLNMFEVFSLGDVSAVVGLPKLRDLQIYGSEINDVDFLWDIQNKDYFSFGIAEVPNWEGLSAIETYSYLNVTDRNGSALPYIKNATVKEFELYNRIGRSNQGEGLDMTMLPHVTDLLKLHCVTSFEGLDQPDVGRMFIEDCPYLTSLSGLEGVPKLTKLGICNCPRLADWTSLYALKLEGMNLEAVFTLPDFGRISAKAIDLITIYDLKDLSAFADYQQNGYDIRLMDVDGVTDLSPLYHLHGRMLGVPAHLQEQAQALVDSGLLDEYTVVYPEGGWQPIEPHIELTSLDEIDTLPSALLSRITRLQLAGDAVLPQDGSHVEEDWSANPPALYIRYDGEEERIPVEPGTLTDLGRLEKLTGLRELTVYAQPQLRSLEGVQAMGDLKSLSIIQCPALADASAAFTVQSLEELRLRYTGVTSLQGIQNLYALRMLDLNDNPVEDLSPLDGCPALEDVHVELPMMTFEELKAQSEGVRRAIRNLSIAGQHAYDGDRWRFEEDWITDPPRLYLRDSKTGERLPLTDGAVMDMAELAALLPNLENLDLYGQPLTTLDGLEGFRALRRITVEECRQLTDYSALWRVPSLEDVSLRNQPIESIEGVENLPHLVSLSLSGTPLMDFSSLARVDFSYSASEESYGGGFGLALDVRDPDRFTYEDYAVLEAVPVYWNLNMNNVSVDRWLGHVMGKEMHELSCHRSGISDEQLRAFIQAHPMLEQLDLRWNPQLRDLSCLLELEHLRKVYLSSDMKAAVGSLDNGYGFDLYIED